MQTKAIINWQDCEAKEMMLLVPYHNIVTTHKVGVKILAFFFARAGYQMIYIYKYIYIY